MQQNRDEATARVINGLKKLYHTKLKPMEQARKCSTVVDRDVH